MKVASFRLVGIAAALLSAMMVGCGDRDEHGSHEEDGDSPAAHEDAGPETEHDDTSEDDTSEDDTSEDDMAEDDMAEDDMAEDDMAEDDEEELDFDDLSLDDRKLAKAQRVCPVSDQELGSMGTPIKIEHDGKVIFLCCQMCKPRFEKDPETYLAKLQKK